MIVRKPMILYYDNGQEEKRKSMEKALSHMGIDLVPVTAAHLLQTVGHLAKVKGFPPRKIPPFQSTPEVTKDVLIMCNFTEEKLDMLRDADAIFREEIANAGLEGAMNQYFAALTNMRSVGVMGDGRTYDYTLALRAVTTSDFMTADWARIPYDLLDKISTRIVNEVQGINRIVYDITSKPPATIEWE